MKKFLIFLCSMLLVFGVAGSASADNVGVWGETLSGFSLSTVNNFYDGLTGHSSSILSDLSGLSGVDLLWATQPADSYSTTELSYMSDFLTDGGRIAFMGEHGSFAPQQNIRIGEALTYFGSGMSIINNYPDAGFHNATKGNGQILDHTLTEGVNTYNYACFAELTITGNAQTLMYGSNLTQVMMGYENILGGSIFLITDQNVWDNVYLASNDNAVMFENLLTGVTGGEPPGNGGPPSVPEPATMLLLGSGLIGLVGFRRKKLFKE